MNRPTLALCVPAYRAEQHLHRLLATVDAQRGPAFDEVIVCVDASPDATAKIASDWGAKVLTNEHNLGCSASKNRALLAATSDWVHFHDADDALLPEFTLEAHRWMVTTNPPEVVMMGFEYRDFSTNELLAVGLFDDAVLATDPVGYAIRNKLPNFGIYRREPLTRIGGFDCDRKVLFNEDMAFHTKLALAGFHFRASSAVTCLNWRHPGSMSAKNSLECLLAHHAVMRKVAQKAEPIYFESIAENMWRLAQGLAMHGEWEALDSALRDAWRLYPKIPQSQARDFGLLCRVIGPRLSFRLREKIIRWLKPALRENGQF